VQSTSFNFNHSGFELNSRRHHQQSVAHRRQSANPSGKARNQVTGFIAEKEMYRKRNTRGRRQ
jgi:hypothetical protein